MTQESEVTQSEHVSPSNNHSDSNRADTTDVEDKTQFTSKPFQFVVYDEDKIYTRRKYVRRKKPPRYTKVGGRLGQEQDICLDVNCKQSFNPFVFPEQHSTGEIDCPPSTDGAELDPFGTLPVPLSPLASQALSFLASHGHRCQLVKTWFARGILDDCLVHSFVLYSVSFPWLFQSPIKGLSDHPNVLPWKIRAIQATNKLLRDERRNTSDAAIVAVSILASLERTSGNIPAMMKHIKGLEIILQERKLKDGTLDGGCPVTRRAAEAGISMGKLLAFDASNVLPIDDPTATAAHTEHLQNRLKASLFCMTRFAGAVRCASSKTYLTILHRLDYMLGVCYEQAQEAPPGVRNRRSEFNECVDILDDLWVSQGIFLHWTESDPMAPAVAKCSWVGAVGTLLWIFLVGLERAPDELDAIKKQMMDWVNHPSVRQMDQFPLLQIREWAEHTCTMVHLGFRYKL